MSQVDFYWFVLDTLVTSLANHLTSENDMRSRYKRKKCDIQDKFDRALVALQEAKLSKEGRITLMFYLLINMNSFIRISATT